MKNMIKLYTFRKGCAALLAVAMLTLCACSGSDSSVLPSSTTSKLTSTASTGTAADTTISLDNATIKIPAGTVMKDSTGAEVAGTLTATAKISQAITDGSASTAATAAALQNAYVLDLAISNGAQQVADLSQPITVTMKLPAGFNDGSQLVHYSHDGIVGTDWSYEADIASVNSDGTVTLSISHLSLHGIFKNTSKAGSYVSGDFHNHTWLTDGSHTETDVVAHAFGGTYKDSSGADVTVPGFGLDWMANSEHGGSYNHAPDGTLWAELVPSVTIQGNPLPSAGKMWRWQSLTEYSFPLLFDKNTGLQSKYPNNTLIQAFEWNCPTHEHASVGIVDQANGTAISNFEYMFDGSDKDTSKTGLTKKNTTHADAIEAVKYLEANYKDTSYFIVNHPSRQQKYTVADFRDFINAGPDVTVGLEGMPGHQKELFRGGYSSSTTEKARTFGGADYMIAKVGGLWDSLLGEGRHFWTFVNSDFHSSADTADFYPGEYAKSYTFAASRAAKDIVAGMKTGNSFAVHGDLINMLDFRINNRPMGSAVVIPRKRDLRVEIRFKSPAKNYNGDAVAVDHIDLISGDITGTVAPTDTANYGKDTNSSTKVLKRFTKADKEWKTDSVTGITSIVYAVSDVTKNQYFRLRGTNLAIPATDTDKITTLGDPVIDNPLTDTTGTNTKAKAWANLWFYSNPVFVTAK